MADQDMEEEEDDLYATSAHETAHDEASAPSVKPNGNAPKPARADEDEDLEEGEEEESEDSESDIEIVTERADLAEPTTSRYQKPPSDSAAPAKDTLSHQSSAPKQPTTIRITSDAQPQPQATTKPILLPGDKYPALHTSKLDLDLDHVPLWNGKPVTEIDLDADIAEQMKPWRRPGADQTDYFNYGFDEFTWATYCMNQTKMAGVLDQQKQEGKMFEQMMGGMVGGGMPGMPTGPAQQQQAGAMGGMPGEQDMQQMFMQAMQAQGVNDPSQVDFGAMMAQFAGGAGGMPGGGMPQGVPTGPGGAPTGPGGGQWQGQQGYQQQTGGRGGRGRRGGW
ncbi:hypothetical protein FKW77_009664 [Venturia effusa]|uniref:Pre-mRNA polyadenylation factor Fip1 domain-containing protein n=1 Tax=Venturia effusa TaxID=50376 RepID=A0A517LD21_9PEZI|nr:hypothetical protein FKW77_009664 [Venturia effusa]